jgi:hypothetical protein
VGKERELLSSLVDGKFSPRSIQLFSSSSPSPSFLFPAGVVTAGADDDNDDCGDTRAILLCLFK